MQHAPLLLLPVPCNTLPGVHLNISVVLKLLSRHPDVLPFLVHISSEAKHVERMAVRAKYMTLDPNKNRWVGGGAEGLAAGF